METIGSVGYERQRQFRPTPPTATPSDHDSDRGGKHDNDQRRRRDDNVPDINAARALNEAQPERVLNLTA